MVDVFGEFEAFVFLQLETGLERTEFFSVVVLADIY